MSHRFINSRKWAPLPRHRSCRGWEATFCVRMGWPWIGREACQGGAGCVPSQGTTGPFRPGPSLDTRSCCHQTLLRQGGYLKSGRRHHPSMLVSFMNLLEDFYLRVTQRIQRRIHVKRIWKVLKSMQTENAVLVKLFLFFPHNTWRGHHRSWNTPQGEQNHTETAESF